MEGSAKVNLQEMADLGPKVPGINWASLRVLAGSRHPVLAARGADYAYFTAFMVPAYQKAAAIVATLDLPQVSDGELRSAYKDGVKRMEALGPAEALTFPVNTLRDNMSMGWAQAAYGYRMHQEGTAQASVFLKINEGRPEGVALDQLALHADAITRQCNAIVEMEKQGALRALKRGATSGVGAIPAIPIGVAVIVIATIAILALLAYFLLSEGRTAELNEKMQKDADDLCKRAQDARDNRTVRKCVELQLDPARTPAMALTKAVSKPLAAIALGAGVVGLVLVGPSLARALFKTRRAIKEGRARA